MRPFHYMLVALLLAPAAVAEAQTTHAQSRQHSHMVSTDDARTLEVWFDGSAEFTDDDRDIASMAPGTRLVISDEPRHGAAYRVEFSESNGAIQRRFGTDRRAEPSPEERAWLDRIMPELVREYGFNVGPRTTRILRRSGPGGVLDEIGRIRSDGVKRAYFMALLQQAHLSPPDMARALREAGQISSDGDRSSVLLAALPGADLGTAAVRDAFFTTADRLSSDGDHSRVLIAALPRVESDEAGLTALLTSAARLSSDGDRARVLISAADAPALTGARARAAFFTAADGISSDGDRSRVLIAVLGAQQARVDVVVPALRSAAHIASDGDKTRVLLAVPTDRLGAGPARAAYQAALDTIHSDGDHHRAELHVAAAGQ